MDYSIRFVRITNSGRLTDRFLTAQVKFPQMDEKIPKGNIFSVMEITTPCSSSSPIGNRIVNTFIQSYYKSNNPSTVVNFELAVKNANETLGRITRNGETNWIGNLNAILAVINENQLFLTQSGKAKSYLFRQSKANDIIGETIQELKPHPLKTFSNIISGSLQPKDKIILASPGLFDYLSIERLRQIIINNNPYQAGKQIADILKREKTRKVNVIIIELNLKEEFSSQIIEDEKDVIYLNKESLSSFWMSVKEQIDIAKPFINKVAENLSKAYYKTAKFSKEKIVPETKKGLSIIYQSWFKSKQSDEKKLQKIKSETDKDTDIKKQIQPKTQTNPSVETPKELKLDKLYKIHHYHNKIDKKSTGITHKIKYLFDKAIQSLNHILSWLTDIKTRPILYTILIIILTAILIFGIVKLRQKQQSNSQLEVDRQELSEMQSRYDDEAKLAILYNDREKAQEILIAIITVCEKLKNIPELKNEADELLEEAQIELDNLTGTIRLKEKIELAEFSNINQFTIVDDILFGTRTGGNKIEILSKIDSSKKEIVIQPTDGTSQLLAYLGDEKNILVYTSEREIYKTNDEKNDLERVYPMRGEWPEVDNLITFFGNIYIVDKTQNQIFKHTKTDDGYEKAVNYIKDDTQTADVVSFAIDGKVYLLKQDGQVIKLNRGKKIDFNISGIPEPTNIIAKPKKIYTDIEADSIWILDNNRIIELDKTGTFINQYVFEELENINDFTIDYESKKFYILDSNKVYEIDY